MTQKEKKNIRAKWKRWFKKLSEQIYFLEWSTNVHKEVERISALSENTGDDTDIFRHWIRCNYYGATGIAVRQLADRMKSSKYNTISFWRLINDIYTHYDALPVSIKKQFKKDEIRTDFNKITTVSAPIATLADKRIAHLDNKGSYAKLIALDPDRFDETLDKFSKLMNDLFEKYNKLLKAGETNLCPNMGGDTWREPIKRAFSNRNILK